MPLVSKGDFFPACTAPERRNGRNHTAAVGPWQVLQGSHGLWNETPSHHPLHQFPGCATPAVKCLGGAAGVQLSPRPHGLRGLPQPGEVHAGGEPLLQGLDGGEIWSGQWQAARLLFPQAPCLPSFANPVSFLSQVCQWVLKCRNSKNSLIQMTILNLLPRLAAFRPSAFTGEDVHGRASCCYPSGVIKQRRHDCRKLELLLIWSSDCWEASLWFLSQFQRYVVQVSVNVADTGTVRMCKQRCF